MAHVAAGDDLQAAAAHPRLEGQLEVLRAPDVKAGVIIPESPEEVPVDTEQSSSNGGGVGGGPGVATPLVLSTKQIYDKEGLFNLTSRFDTVFHLKRRVQSNTPMGA